jgi:predicted transcriptional regulator
MSLTINLSPELETQLNALAESQGIKAEDLARRLIEARLCDELALQNGSDASKEQRPLTREEVEAKLVAGGVRLGNPERLIALLDSWIAEGENASPEEIRAADEELAEFKKAMNENRARNGERLLYP